MSKVNRIATLFLLLFITLSCLVILVSPLIFRSFEISFSEEIQIFIGKKLYDFNDMINSARKHAEEAINFWGYTNIRYVETQFDCQRLICQLQMLHVGIDVKARFFIPSLATYGTTLEYTFRIAENKVLSSSSNIDLRSTDQNGNWYEIPIALDKIIEIALQSEKPGFISQHHRYSLGISWNTFDNIWIINMFSGEDGISFSIDVSTGSVVY